MKVYSVWKGCFVLMFWHLYSIHFAFFLTATKRGTLPYSVLSSFYALQKSLVIEINWQLQQKYISRWFCSQTLTCFFDNPVIAINSPFWSQTICLYRFERNRSKMQIQTELVLDNFPCRIWINKTLLCIKIFQLCPPYISVLHREISGLHTECPFW